MTASVIQRTLAVHPALLLGALVLQLSPASAGSPPPSSNAVAHVQAQYDAAKLRHQQATNSPEASANLARATFEMADLPSQLRNRDDLAIEGIAAARAALAAEPSLAAAHYYLAMNLGQLARCRPLSALRLVRQIETAFQKTLQLDPSFDYAGPHRNVGTLYRDAPGWPTSVGNKSKARKHFEAAVSLMPDYPDNRLTLAESLLQWKEPDAALPHVDALRDLLPGARQKLSGPAWELLWADWDYRWSNLSVRIKSHPKP